jgi:hypothetical protein
MKLVGLALLERAANISESLHTGRIVFDRHAARKHYRAAPSLCRPFAARRLGDREQRVSNAARRPCGTLLGDRSVPLDARSLEGEGDAS